MGGFRRGGQRRMLWAVVVSVAIHAVLIAVFVSREPEPPSAAPQSRVLAATISFGRGAVDGDDSGPVHRRASVGERMQDADAPSTNQADIAGNRAAAPNLESGRAPHEPVVSNTKPDSAGRLEAVGDSETDTSGSRSDSLDGESPSGGGSSTGRSSLSQSGAALVQPPQPVEPIVPEYPRIARRRGLEGEVVIRVTISLSGDPLSAEIVLPSDHRVLNDAAIAAVQGARFQPGRVGDQPTEMSMSIRIVFELS